MIEPEDHVEGTCWHCGLQVSWDEEDKRASEHGSFVDPSGNFECSSSLLHQG